MPPIARRTREQLSTSIARLLMGQAFVTGLTTSAGGDATSVIDTKLRGGNNIINGRWILFIDGTLGGEVSRIADYDQATTDITVSPAYTATVPNAANFEIWLPEFEPAAIHEFINLAILDSYGLAYDPTEDISLHTGGSTTHFSIPSDIAVISDLYYRNKVNGDEIHGCESAFDESVASGITVTVDTNVKRRGSSSVLFTVAAAAAAGALVTDSVTDLDIRDRTHVEFWIQSSITTAAGDIKLLLDDTASCASPLETLSIPALTAGLWTFVRIALATPHLATAIISVGLEFTTDNGAGFVWLDDVGAVTDDPVNNNSTAEWSRVARSAWKLDKEAADLVLTDWGQQSIGYALLKLKGGDIPALMSSDASINEVDDLFVIYKAIELALRANEHVKPSYGQRALIYSALSEERRKSLARHHRGRRVR